MPDSSAGRCALLLMDLQRAVVDTYGTHDPTYANRIRRAATAGRRAGLPVIWVIVRLRPGYPDVSPRNRAFLAIRESGRFTEGDGQSELHPGLEFRPQDMLVTKRRVSAFCGSDLEILLRALDIDTLVLGGIATSGVVLSTVRQAADLDYRLTVLRDGCLDSDPEVHRVLTDKVFPRQATVQTVDEWIGTLTSSPRLKPGDSP